METLLSVLSKLDCFSFCAYCKKGIAINNKWIYVSKEEGEIINKMCNVSHGCCPVCFKEVKKEIEAYKQEKARLLKELKS